MTLTNTLISGVLTGITSTHVASSTVMAGYTVFDPGVHISGNVSFNKVLWGEPAFLNPTGSNYHIAFTSAAREAGVAAGVATDIDGDARPIGPKPDVGADESIYTAGMFLPLVMRSYP
jgi:hypothetical protein